MSDMWLIAACCTVEGRCRKQNRKAGIGARRHASGHHKLGVDHLTSTPGDLPHNCLVWISSHMDDCRVSWDALWKPEVVAHCEPENQTTLTVGRPSQC